MAGRYTRRGGARLSVQGEPLLVPTRDNHEVPPMQRRPTVGPGSQKAPFRERLPGAISKLGTGTALHSRQTCRGVGVGRLVDRMSGVGVCCSRPGSRMVVRGGGSGSGSFCGSGAWGGEWG